MNLLEMMEVCCLNIALFKSSESLTTFEFGIGTIITTVSAHGRNGKPVVITYGNEDTRTVANISQTSTGIAVTATVTLNRNLDHEVGNVYVMFSMVWFLVEIQ